MKDIQINEGNVLIADFMGKTWWQAYKEGFYKPLWSDRYNSKEDCQQQIEKYFSGVLHKYAPKLCYDNYYHTSWDWLMPVVKKIQQLAIKDFTKKKPVMNAIMDVEIEPLWISCVDFIKFYNTHHTAVK